jgi:hypothetical protein
MLPKPRHPKPAIGAPVGRAASPISDERSPSVATGGETAAAYRCSIQSLSASQAPSSYSGGPRSNGLYRGIPTPCGILAPCSSGPTFARPSDGASSTTAKPPTAKISTSAQAARTRRHPDGSRTVLPAQSMKAGARCGGLTDDSNPDMAAVPSAKRTPPIVPRNLMSRCLGGWDTSTHRAATADSSASRRQGPITASRSGLSGYPSRA